MRCGFIITVVALLSQITLYAQSGTVQRDSLGGIDFIRDSLKQYVDCRDSLNHGVSQLDSLKRPQCSLDSLRNSSVSVGANLIYLASSSLNAHFWIPLNDNFTIGLTAGLKPWPRWAPWDWDDKQSTRWRHFAIVPGFRWWPKGNYYGFFAGADLLWTHYNTGGVTFPLGLYPEVRDHRLQGDFFGLGVTAGWSWWLTQHLRLEVEAGVAGGYNIADKSLCTWCGAHLGKVDGIGAVPKLGLSLAYNIFDAKKGKKTQKSVNINEQRSAFEQELKEIERTK